MFELFQRLVPVAVPVLVPNVGGVALGGVALALVLSYPVG